MILKIEMDNGWRYLDGVCDATAVRAFAEEHRIFIMDEMSGERVEVKSDIGGWKSEDNTGVWILFKRHLDREFVGAAVSGGAYLLSDSGAVIERLN